MCLMIWPRMKDNEIVMMVMGKRQEDVSSGSEGFMTFCKRMVGFGCYGA